jgi:hypothetical protein
MHKLIGKLSEKKEQHRVLSNDYPYFYLSILWIVSRKPSSCIQAVVSGRIDRVIVAMLDRDLCNAAAGIQILQAGDYD